MRMTDKTVFDLNGQMLPNAGVVASICRALRNTQKDSRKIAIDDFYGIDFTERSKYYKDLIFKALLAYARQEDVEWVSLSWRQLTAPRIKGKKTFDEMFAWEAPKVIGLPGGSGNGLGETGSQSWISDSLTYFDETHFGTWDPRTETKIFDYYITLDWSKHAVKSFHEGLLNGTLKSDPLLLELLEQEGSRAKIKSDTEFKKWGRNS